MKISTVKGTNDYLPKEAALRDYLMDEILKTYQSCGFQRIMTPVIEDIENLDKSEGGENLNLIFKVLKRGDKLEKALEAKNEKELCDMGLRYDLTLPLSRYYANNRDKLLSPFKCIQIDRVYRAERPQKGRLREFYQCDIDIIGTYSLTAEVELIATTAQALKNIGIGDFRVKINNRKLLKAILLKAGFQAEELDSVCISIDKLDKVGLDGVKEELNAKGFEAESINKLSEVLSTKPFTLEEAERLCPEEESVKEIRFILDSVKAFNGEFDVVYDITLIRGQGYYTGTVFEVESTKFRGAIAGGGRYDNLIGKFLNETVPAVGFSIGFERIFGILTDVGFQIPDRKKQIAVLYEEKDFIPAMEYARGLRENHNVAMYVKPKKTGKFIDKLQEQGCDGFYIYGQSGEIQFL
ncbi:histidine--tRNA ligase [Anaerocolumna xylanovorans]|uniref:Histidine--tRNA ligase n=1 Tax=Anaerocolumna xylanovorans DSM 12503 TaxID=1121345 RepID=A0A1M7XZK0_9FIRM|nr:histidine--tRNA ligase [Anaerocolumna xylanovorans]SHO44590.1 histidyl-tRNA synthetase [Anaerocolumna xylanovorans DSM 12503]